MEVINKLFEDVVEETKNKNAKVIFNAAIFIGLGLVESILVDEIFRCPCEPPILGLTYPSIPFDWNVIYSIMFFIMPAWILALLSLLQDNDIWYLFMGCCHRRSQFNEVLRRVCCCCCSCEDKDQHVKAKKLRQAIVKAFVIAIYWISLALSDGNYYACLTTSVPYNRTCDIVRATETKKLPFTDEYNINKEISQLVGILLLVVTVLIYFLTVCIGRCWRDTEYAEYIIVKNYMILKEDVIEKKIEKALGDALNKEFDDIGASFGKKLFDDIKKQGDEYFWNGLVQVKTADQAATNPQTTEEGASHQTTNAGTSQQTIEMETSRQANEAVKSHKTSTI